MTLTRRIVVFIILMAILIYPAFAVGRSKTENSVDLTAEEKAFIAEHPVIHLAVDPKFIPYEFVDKDGAYKGIAADYIQLLSARTGLRFEAEKGLTWTDAYEKAVQKQLDACPCISKTPEREKYFLFSNPYYPFQRVIFINENNKDIKSFSDLENHTVAVQLNSSHYSYLKAFENIELSTYTTVEEGLQAVSDGKETAFVGNMATSSYLIKANGITNLKFITIDAEEKQYLYFAVRKDWPILLGIINKGLASITEEEKIEIDNRWIGVQSKIDYGRIIRIAGITLSIIALVLVVSVGWIIMLRREVKKRRQTEIELKIAKEEAELANNIKSAFLARMSHEIRTPLNAITGMAYIMKKTDLTATQKVYLDKINRASRDMLGIINDILDFSKIEAGKVSIERISFNLDEVLEQLVNMVAFKIEEQKNEFSMHKDAEIPAYFFGDPKRIEQVLLNLVNNALKFTKDGAVSLSIRLVARVKDTYTMDFSVKDTGIGMSEEQLSQLFIPFSQADSSISRRFGGTGLGLSIVKSLVEMMGGTINVYSEPGEGSTFNIQMSLEADREKEYEVKKRSASVYFQNIRVLVVEKSLFYTNMLRDYLDSFNLIAEFTQSGERALHLIEAASKENGKPYDLLIVDHESVDEGGIEFCSRMKHLQGLKEVPKTMLLIPLSREDLFDQLEAAGLDFGITKPIIPSVLYNGIIEIFKINVLENYDNSVLAKKTEKFVADYPYKVLIIEDNLTNQFIAQSILEEAGFAVTLADNGKEGCERFKRDKGEYHLILMDLHMPVMNGFEAATLIREWDDRIPIVAMTADAITGVEAKCKEIGINYYISKPFEPDQFIETVWQAIKSQDSPATANTKAQIEENSETISVLDIQDGIRHVGGNRELYKMVVSAYYKENQGITALLGQAISERKYNDAAQIVHKVKSSTGSIGAKTLFDISIKLYESLGKGETEEIEHLYMKFSELLEAVLKEIEALVS